MELVPIHGVCQETPLGGGGVPGILGQTGSGREVAGLGRRVGREVALAAATNPSTKVGSGRPTGEAKGVHLGYPTSSTATAVK